MLSYLHETICLYRYKLMRIIYALDCYVCQAGATGSCFSESTETCHASKTNCASITETHYEGDTLTSTMKRKSCAAQDECVTGSVNIGIARKTVNTECCSTDLCNTALAPELPNSSPNGKKCFTCVGNNCTSTLECKGSEDRCINATESTGGQAMTTKGCASQTFCSGSLNAQIESNGVDLNCCEGNLCNNALRIGQSVLFLLLVPLASVILFN
ncbi:urokinase plasminogen activator surface receptor-like [Anguilla anguilla]|uniref:urokinase plasminogen activator surface receptor-like n=1 Tax=Anguilla anguilla TaxID=7936 RepID=UPI0015AF2F44|nr:urokinase plasminogen activator surface receptor-like [Anguilla anguilla]